MRLSNYRFTANAKAISDYYLALKNTCFAQLAVKNGNRPQSIGSRDMNNNFDHRLIEVRILWYKTKIRKIQNFIRSKNVFAASRMGRRILTSEMRMLKDRFELDRKLAESDRLRQSKNKHEKQDYDLVKMAGDCLQVEPNSHPLGTNWMNELERAILELDLYYPGL